MMARRISLTGAFLRSTPLEEKLVVARELRDRVWPLLGSTISPRIDAVFPLARAADAHRHMESNTTIGKIVLDVAHD